MSTPNPAPPPESPAPTEPSGSQAIGPAEGAAIASAPVAQPQPVVEPLPVAAPPLLPVEPRPPLSLGKTLLAAAITTAVVTALSSRLVPDKFAATLVGLAFLAATWLLVLRHDENTIRAYGLSLGGLLEPAPLSPPRLLRDAAVALAWVLLFCAIVFPPFWFGYRLYWGVRLPFMLRFPPSILDEVAGQLLVIALPEEAFFRGFLQTSLDHAWPPRFRVLGANVGLGLLVSSAIFAVGHLLTTPHQPARLAVFFPALLFGWLRARTGGIGAGMTFHALCNIFSATLARGYGLP